jgi:hypothetical protein
VAPHPLRKVGVRAGGQPQRQPVLSLTAGSAPDLPDRAAIVQPVPARKPELPPDYLWRGAGSARKLRGIWLEIRLPPLAGSGATGKS